MCNVFCARTGTKGHEKRCFCMSTTVILHCKTNAVATQNDRSCHTKAPKMARNGIRMSQIRHAERHERRQRCSKTRIPFVTLFYCTCRIFAFLTDGMRARVSQQHRQKATAQRMGQAALKVAAGRCVCDTSPCLRLYQARRQSRRGACP